MWFKHLQVFRLMEPFNLSYEQLEAALAAQPARPCGKTELASYGWTSPFGSNAKVFVHACSGRYLIAAQKEKRLLPASVVRSALAAKLAAIYQAEGRMVRGKEKARLKDELTFSLLPQAFSCQQVTYAYIDPTAGWLMVNSSSRNRAEELTSLLRTSLGSLKLVAPVTNEIPAQVLSNILLTENIPSRFTIEDSCVMLDAKTRAKTRCDKQMLFNKEVQAHLESGMLISQLAMTWDDRLTFVLADDLSIKRIRPLDVLQEQAKAVHAETEVERLDADFALMAAEFAEFLTAIFNLFGGLKALENNLTV